MLTETDKNTIKELSQKYHVKRVLIFGSSLDPEKESNDIDIAIEGISSQDYYTLWRPDFLTFQAH